MNVLMRNSKSVYEKCKKKLQVISRNTFILVIGFYRVHLSGFLGGNCRFYPSCSEYAEQAFKQLPTKVALLRVGQRLCRCHPFGAGGYDPVPQVKGNCCE